MAMDHNPSSRRPHYHRGRRGTDRRGTERRGPQAAESTRGAGDQVDVEQLLREIRARISQRGIDLTAQQIQDLAASRLEAILDPRTINPTLFDQLRKGAAAAEPVPPAADAHVAIDEEALYRTGGAAARFMRRLLNPLLKPILEALEAQAQLNREVAASAAERERRQTEWNALHYQILQRLVTEVSRNSIEVQALGMRLESLGARVDFTDRRMRALEHAPLPARAPRSNEAAQAPPAVAVTEGGSSETATAAGQAPLPAEAPRRRRRRRRGRRGSLTPLEPGQTSSAPDSEPEGDVNDTGVNGDEDEERPAVPSPTPATIAAAEPALPQPTLPGDEPAPEPAPAPADPGPQER